MAIGIQPNGQLDLIAVVCGVVRQGENGRKLKAAYIKAAKAVGVSRSHLYRVFMSNVGQSPIDYLTGYRISEACSLLKNTGLSIAEIAVSVGFFDQFYFSRVFKKVKGVPPSKYLAALEKDPQLGLV